MDMRVSSKKLRFIIYATLLIAGGRFIGNKLAVAITAGMQKTVVLYFLLSLLLIVPYLYKRLGLKMLSKGLFFLFWLPVPILLSRYTLFSRLYIYEFSIWLLLGLW